MYNSIQQFYKNGIEPLEKLVKDFSENPENVADFVTGVGSEVLKLATNIIAETFEDLDKALNSSQTRKLNWVVERHESASILTSLGTVNYSKTLFKSRKDKSVCCLLDKMMNIEAHERMTPDALARILEDTVSGSYEKGGSNATMTGLESVSREAVKEKIHSLEFPVAEKPKEKKKIKNLYVSADEDHISLQFNAKKGDLEKDERGYLKNGCISKLVYVYEGRELVSEGKRKRYQLNGLHCFSGVYEGSEANKKLWEEVSDYIEDNYEIEDDGHIFVTSDGGSWIETAKDLLGAKAVMVQDEFHMEKYMLKATNKCGDSSDDFSSALRKAVYSADKKETEEIFENMAKYLEDIYKGEENATVLAKSLKGVEEGREYIHNNWSRITVLQKYAKDLHGCSAEGHVSHVLSARMSSRPMGWSRRGADKMSHLRAYWVNGGNMLKLAKYQKTIIKDEEDEELKKLQKIKFSGEDIIKSEKHAKNNLEKYYGLFQGTIAGRTARKQAGIILSIGAM